MDHDEFIGEVQHRAQLGSRGEAERAVRTTLTALSERIDPGQADNLGAQLPEEVGRHLEKVEDVESFPLDEFFDRVTESEGIDREDAVYHAQVVMNVVAEAVSGGALDDVHDQLPDEYDQLFELVGAEPGPDPDPGGE